MTTLQDLPNEVLHEIFLFLRPTSIPVLQQVCRRFNDISQPLLWRHYCQEIFKFWSPAWQIQEKLSKNVNQTDWRAVFLERHHLDREISALFDSLLSIQHGRIVKAEAMLSHGYDIKDTLLRSVLVDENAPDVLARRYYSSAVLGSLHRSLAIQEWARLLRGEEVPLDRALGCFDMFILKVGEHDLDAISHQLNHFAEDLLTHNPEIVHMAEKQKCLEIAAYLRSRHLVGIDADVDSNYHNLQNNFIGKALRTPSHPSLPLVSVAIFCCVAQRLGIDAHPCGYPFHVYAIISLRDDVTDGAQERPAMYMDPFRSAAEVYSSDLKSQLMSMGVNPNEHHVYLGAAPTIEMVRRCAKNILTSVQTTARNGHPVDDLNDVDGAAYSAMWALSLLSEGDNIEQTRLQRSSAIMNVVQSAEILHPYDFSLIEKHILLNFPNLALQVRSHVATSRARIADHTPKVPKSRTANVTDQVRYKVGSCFRHRRYNYHAIITGWDIECLAGDAWISRMRVNDLSRGRYQSFYHVQVEDGSYRYVAEDNIQLVKTQPGDELMAMAGKYFKRWGSDARIFVSNITDEYPDD